MLLADTSQVIELSGHADAAERSPTPLAYARAQVIREALVARSIPPARLRAVSYAASGASSRPASTPYRWWPD